MRKKHRNTPLFLSVLLTGMLLALVWVFRSWVPPLITVEPRLRAPGVREGAGLATKPERTEVLQSFTFDKGQASMKDWEEKVFKGHTAFTVLKDGGRSYLNSKSADACSGLFVKTEQPSTPDLWISWKWRADEFPQKKHPELLSNKSEDDFAARVYVIFMGPNLFKSDVIEYIWDERFAPGTSADSPYSDRVKLLVIRSGPAGPENGGWAGEERNLYEDYQELFGKAPRKPVGLVALMSDSDNTETKASADFAEIILKRKQAVPAG